MAIESGLISYQCKLLKDMLLDSATWQSWAGANYLNSVYYHANLTNIEGTNNYINAQLQTPFAVIFLSQFTGNYNSPGCFTWSQQIALLIQDTARSPTVHSDSFIEYSNQLGPVIEEISAQVGNRPSGDSLGATTINMVGEPMRVGPLDQNEEHDFWTSTWVFIPSVR